MKYNVGVTKTFYRYFITTQDNNMSKRVGSYSNEIKLKLLMIGDSGVGKSCLLLRYVNNSFSPVFINTTGIDFKIKYIEIDDKWIKLKICDTAGQERSTTTTLSLYQGAQGILLVYDVTNRSSFESFRYWISQIRKHANEFTNLILVGNKCDMTKERVVPTEEGQKLANQFGIGFREVSAKDGNNVESLFASVAKEVKDSVAERKKLFPKQA